MYFRPGAARSCTTPCASPTSAASRSPRDLIESHPAGRADRGPAAERDLRVGIILIAVALAMITLGPGDRRRQRRRPSLRGMAAAAPSRASSGSPSWRSGSPSAAAPADSSSARRLTEQAMGGRLGEPHAPSCTTWSSPPWPRRATGAPSASWCAATTRRSAACCSGWAPIRPRPTTWPRTPSWRPSSGSPSSAARATFAGWVKRIAARLYLRRLAQAARRARRTRPRRPRRCRQARATAAQRIDLDEALQGLSPAERMCVRLCYGGGLSHARGGGGLECPLGTVKSHVKRGLDKLRSRLAAPSGAAGGAGSWLSRFRTHGWSGCSRSRRGSRDAERLRPAAWRPARPRVDAAPRWSIGAAGLVGGVDRR